MDFTIKTVVQLCEIQNLMICLATTNDKRNTSPLEWTGEQQQQYWC